MFIQLCKLGIVIIRCSEIAGIVDRFLKPNGIFISSGIIYMKEDDVKEAVKKNENLQLTDVVKQGDWRAVMAKLQ